MISVSFLYFIMLQIKAMFHITQVYSEMLRFKVRKDCIECMLQIPIDLNDLKSYNMA